MKSNYLNLTTLILLTHLITPNKGFAQTQNPKKYICQKTHSPIEIDGKLDERVWAKALWTSRFVDIEGDVKPLPYQHTQAKMLWDDKNLYIAAIIEEEHIWAYQQKKDQIVYLENDFEVFIDPDGDGENYYELEINAINNTFDLFLPRTYKNGGRAQLKWDIKDLKSAVNIDGTLNDARDKDKRWILEIAIPFASLSHENVPAIMPESGSEWRINFSRVNWQHEISDDGKYARKRNPETGKVLPEYNWVWSPQGIINMHFPEYWGYLQFVDSKEKKNKK
ncbi:carbohydrate-binding family 9-like protein [Dyadobacter sp. CY347]|uniref:carbohydrate-binding family 9-like protein n=1 Tax=Dyadobacter sp. CY347 TaxID=2909336 RepID=UPI001F1B6A16|nr:carbohydrate-binding family 9-like protein [Dyadobacter sp. CY347]MCF2488310.1 carbohydrate-binding family 9-like protein [Dyadobacter sp. CY347]